MSTSYYSEIRPSQINELFEKASSQNYGKYLRKLRLVRARSFTDKTLNFDFPVTAIVGPNGGGKTTVLGAAACAYKSVKPGTFFPKSGKFDTAMQDWQIEYELIDKKLKPNDTIRRTASFKNFKWNREGMDRKVEVFGVSRTVPASERKEMHRCISGQFSVPIERIAKLQTPVADAVKKILDKDVDHFSLIKVDTKGRVTLLAGETSDGKGYSEFHFGAGESSVIRMAIKLEDIEENALVLIEEIENGLHPVATIRMVEYLIDLAIRKRIQVIFTTHSNEALLPLPDKAIWAAVNGQLFQGKLDISSLRAISGHVSSKLVIFVEDSFAKLWIESILRTIHNVAMDAIGVHAMEGDGTAVKVNKSHNIDPSTSQKSICLIDGDSKQAEEIESNIFRLPGQSPESYVYDGVLENIDDHGGELAVALLRKYDEHTKTAETIRSIRNTNRDPHVLFSQVGKKLGLITESRVQEAFTTIWAQTHEEETQRILSNFSKSIPLESDEQPLSKINTTS